MRGAGCHARAVQPWLQLPAAEAAASVCAGHGPAAADLTRSVAAQGLGVTPTMTFKTVMIIFGKFIYLFAISLVMGIAFGFAASYIIKKYQPSGLPQVRFCWVLGDGCCSADFARAASAAPSAVAALVHAASSLLSRRPCWLY